MLNKRFDLSHHVFYWRIAAPGSQEDESNEHERGKEESPHIARFFGVQLRFEDVRSHPRICMKPDSD